MEYVTIIYIIICKTERFCATLVKSLYYLLLANIVNMLWYRISQTRFLQSRILQESERIEEQEQKSFAGFGRLERLGRRQVLEVGLRPVGEEQVRHARRRLLEAAQLWWSGLGLGISQMLAGKNLYYLEISSNYAVPAKIHITHVLFP